MRLRCFPVSMASFPVAPPLGWRYRLFTPTTVILGGVLVVAAAMKLWSLHQGYDPLQLQPIHSPGLTFAAACVELCVGLWLTSGIAPAWSRIAGLCLFLILLAAAASEFAQGAPSCGCFGRLHTAPLEMVAFDGLAFIVMGIVSPPLAKGLKSYSAVRPLMSALAGAVIVLVSAHAHNSAVSRKGYITVYFDVRASGGAFPSANLLDEESRNKIQRGQWTLVFFDHTCAECRDFLDRVGSGQIRLGDHSPVRAIDISNYDGAIYRAPIPLLRVKEHTQLLLIVAQRS